MRMHKAALLNTLKRTQDESRTKYVGLKPVASESFKRSKEIS